MITGAETAHLTPKTPTIYLEGKLPLVIERTAAELGLRDGQVVQATATVVNHQLKLVLNDHIFNLPLQPYIKEGDLVQLRAQLLPAGKWALQLLHTGNFAGPDAPPAAMPR